MMNTQEHPNVALIREFFDVFGRADEARLHEIMASDILWHMPGKSPIAGDWAGVDGILNGIRATALRLGDGTYGFELLHVFADEERAVSVHRDFYTGEGNHFDLRFMIFYDIRDGQIAELWEVPFDQYECDRFFNLQEERLSKRSA